MVCHPFCNEISGLAMKVCTRCLIEKEYSEFHRDASRRDGHCHRCKQCDAQYRRDCKLRRKDPKHNSAITRTRTDTFRDQYRATMTHKRCSECGVQKPKEQFLPDSRSVLGLAPACRACGAKQRESRRQRTNAYYRKYRAENPERIRIIKRRWRRNNPEKVREEKRRWREKHPDVVRESKKRRRAAKAGAAVTLSHNQAARLVGDRTGICAYCGEYTEELTQDHITPLTQGGNHSLGNIVMVCRPCNSRKGVNPVLSWLLDSRLAKTALTQLRMKEARQ